MCAYLHEQQTTFKQGVVVTVRTPAWQALSSHFSLPAKRSESTVCVRVYRLWHLWHFYLLLPPIMQPAAEEPHPFLRVSHTSGPELMNALWTTSAGSGRPEFQCCRMATAWPTASAPGEARVHQAETPPDLQGMPRRLPKEHSDL